jgi:two-component system response regulator RpfG
MNVLIVDDQASQRTMLRHLVEDIGKDIQVTDFSDPVHALLWSQKEPPDLVILDYRMPKMDGLEFTRRFRRPLSQRDVPIMLVTVVGDEPLRNAALEAGVIDFIVKPIRPREMRSRCKNLLELSQRQQALKSRAFDLEHQLISGAHDQQHRERDLLSRISKAIGYRAGRDLYRDERLSRYAGLLAEAAGLDDDQIRTIELAAPLHDIGNFKLPDMLLGKPGTYTDDERASMQEHTRHGHELLRDSSSGFIQVAAEIALNHHERWDGSGYPEGKSGENIPISARVVAVADVLDALTTPRAHRDAWNWNAALEHLDKQSGRQFDPALIRALIDRSAEAEEIRNTFSPDGKTNV